MPDHYIMLIAAVSVLGPTLKVHSALWRHLDKPFQKSDNSIS